MENNGTYHALIEAKRLVLSSPEYVYDYLEKHSEKLPLEVFGALFKCNNELIKLGLAKFCNDHEILRKLYVESAKEDGEVMRCAVFSNPHCEISGFLSPFEDDEKKSILPENRDRIWLYVFSCFRRAFLKNPCTLTSTWRVIISVSGDCRGFFYSFSTDLRQSCSPTFYISPFFLRPCCLM